MLSDEFLDLERANLKALGDQLHKEAHFAKQFIENGKRPENEINWLKTVRSACIYGTFLIKNLLDSLEQYRDKSEEQIGFYIGKVAIQSFLDIVNAFEQSTNNLIEDNSDISKILSVRVDQKIKLIEESWKENTNKKSRKLKSELIRLYKRKFTEMKFVRDSLLKNKIIDDLDKKILDFVWDIRNSMHSNFVAIKDIEFSAPGTSLNYSFKFDKGQELYHPRDLLSFFTMTEQLIFIQLKVLQHFNKLNLPSKPKKARA